MIITFEQLHAEVRAFHAAEAARNAPAAVACRAIDTLCSALADCTAIERAEILALLADELRPVIADLAAGA